MSAKSLTTGITSFILSVLSIVLAWFGWYAAIGFACALTSIILSSLTIKSQNNALAITGLVIGIIGIVCCVIGAGCTMACASACS